MGDWVANKRWRKHHPEAWLLEKKRYLRRAKVEALRQARVVREFEPWSAEHDEMILARKKPDRALAAELGRSLQAIQIRRSRLINGREEHRPPKQA